MICWRKNTQMNKISDKIKFAIAFMVIWTAVTLESVAYKIQKDMQGRNL